MTIEVKQLDDRTEYYKDGVLHRDNDLPAVEFANGYKAWYQNGLRHRDNDLPAVEYVGDSKEWFQNGQLHREVGPAVEWFDGTMAWWVNGVQLTEEEFNKQYGFDPYDYAMGLL